MAIDPKSLTVDYRTLQAIPFRDRRALLYSSYADQINSALTPGQRANLFPSYYARDAAAARSALTGASGTLGGSSAANRERTGAGVGFSDSNTVEGQPENKGPPARTASEFRAVEANPFLAGYVDKTRRVESSNSKFGNFSPREKATLDFISKREGSKNQDIIFGDIGNKPGTGKYSRALGLDKRPLSDHSIAEVITLQKKLTAITRADGVAGGVGTSAVGTGQMIRGTLIGNLRSLGIPEEDWDKIKFDDTLQKRLTLENFKSSGIGNPNGDPRQWNHTVLGEQYESLNTSKGFNAMSSDEMDSIIKASPERPKEVDEQTATPDAMSVVQEVASQTVSAAEIKGAQTATSEAEGGATGFYSQLRNSYPDKIDKDSPIWDQIDPELKKSKHLVVDAETGLVGRDALLAADASSKVLRNNGMIPRIASGGDNHSTNHGQGRSANYSIDLAASIQTESGIKDLRVGSGISSEIKSQMAIAAKLSSENASGNFRVGIPLQDSNASMHIQVDPELPSRAWGYSEAAKRANVNMSIRALQRTEEGQSYIKQLENLSDMQPEEKSKMLASMTGIKEKEAKQTVEQTQNEVVNKAAAVAPANQTVNGQESTTSSSTQTTQAQEVVPTQTATTTEEPQSQTTPVKTMAQGGIVPSYGENEIVTRAPTSGEVIQRTKISEYGSEQVKVEPISKMKAEALTPVKNDLDVAPQMNEDQQKPAMQRSSMTASKIPSSPYSNITSEIKKPTATALRAALQIRMGNTAMGDYVA